jgi:hypothetical protein
MCSFRNAASSYAKNLLAALVVSCQHRCGGIFNFVACMAEPERAVCQQRSRVSNAKEQTGMGLEVVAEELGVIVGLSL